MAKENIKSSRRVQYSEDCNGHDPSLTIPAYGNTHPILRFCQKPEWHQRAHERQGALDGVGSGNSGTRIPEILARSAAAGKTSSKFR
jgi:hypothetical protein